MKQILFLIGALMAYSSVKAQTILPFVQDGKVWIYEGRDYNEGVWEEIFSLEGDTVIDSRPCVKLYITYTWPSPPYPPHDHEYHGAMYEDGGKVYVIARDSTTPVLLYDFSSEPGTVVKVGDFEVKINEKKLVKYRGEYLKVIYYGYYNDLWQKFCDDDGLDWIEGVGVHWGAANLTCFMDGYGPWFVGGIRHIKSCTVNGEVVFDADEYFKTSQIVTVIGKPSVQPSDRAKNLYDLQGRRIPAKHQRGVYIEDGKKILK